MRRPVTTSQPNQLEEQLICFVYRSAGGGGSPREAGAAQRIGLKFNFRDRHRRRKTISSQRAFCVLSCYRERVDDDDDDDTVCYIKTPPFLDGIRWKKPTPFTSRAAVTLLGTLQRSRAQHEPADLDGGKPTRGDDLAASSARTRLDFRSIDAILLLLTDLL